MRITTVTVKGDHDQVYTIAVKDGYATCTCPAYAWAVRTGAESTACKHIKFVASRFN